MRRLLAVVLSLLPAVAFGAASDAQPVPIKNTAQRVTFPILDADGDLVTGATGLDSECSCDGGTFADCTNEATEIATSSGIYYLDLSSGEANCATLAVIVKTGTAGAKTTPLVVYPATSTGEQIPIDARKWAGAATATDDVALITNTGASLTAIPWNAAWDAEVESEVDDSIGGGTGTALTAIPWNASWDTEVQSEVDDGLVAQRLDELLNADSDIDGAAPPTVGSLAHEMLSKTAGSFTYDQTTDSGEAIRDRGDAAWITATGFSTLTQADIRTAMGLASANLDTQLSAIDDYVDTEVAAILADTAAMDTADEMQTLVWDSTTVRALTELDEDNTTIDLNASTVGTVTTLTGHTPQTGDSFARLGAPAGASVSADIAAIKAETANILSDTNLYDTDAEHATAIWNAATATYGSAGSYGEALEAVGAAPSAATIADAVWDEAQSGHTSAGTFGKYLDAQVSAAATPPTAAAIADQVWDEVLSGHLTAGTTGYALNAAGAAGDPWSTSLPGSYSTNTAGWIIGTKLNAATVTTTSPVSSSGQAVSIIKGDDYYNADGRALTFTSSSWSLTGSTVKMYLKRNGVTALTVTGTVSSATVCYFELTRTQTAALTEGTYQLAVQEIEAGVSAHVGTLLLESTATVYATPNP